MDINISVKESTTGNQDEYDLYINDWLRGFSLNTETLREVVSHEIAKSIQYGLTGWIEDQDDLPVPPISENGELIDPRKVSWEP